MRRLLIFLAIAAVALGAWLYFSKPQPPPDYAAIARPVLTRAAAANTDDQRLTAILDAHTAFIDITDQIDSVEAARAAAAHLAAIADAAKRIDDTLRESPDAYRALLDRRESEVQQAAVQLGAVIMRFTFRPKQLTEFLDPLEKLSATLQK